MFEEWANDLLKLIDEHKLHCNRADCNIQLMSYRKLYEFLIGRELTEKELIHFI